MHLVTPTCVFSSLGHAHHYKQTTPDEPPAPINESNVGKLNYLAAWSRDRRGRKCMSMTRASSVRKNALVNNGDIIISNSEEEARYDRPSSVLRSNSGYKRKNLEGRSSWFKNQVYKEQNNRRTGWYVWSSSSTPVCIYVCIFAQCYLQSSKTAEPNILMHRRWVYCHLLVLFHCICNTCKCKWNLHR